MLSYSGHQIFCEHIYFLEWKWIRRYHLYLSVIERAKLILICLSTFIIGHHNNMLFVQPDAMSKCGNIHFQIVNQEVLRILVLSVSFCAFQMTHKRLHVHIFFTKISFLGKFKRCYGMGCSVSCGNKWFAPTYHSTLATFVRRPTCINKVSYKHDLSSQLVLS